MSLCAFCFLSQGCTSQEVRFFLWRAVEKFKGGQAGILSAMVWLQQLAPSGKI